MLQQAEPDDYVIATGETHSPREFVELAFAHAGLDPTDFVKQSTVRCCARPRWTCCWPTRAKARRELGWQAQTSFAELVRIMVEADLAQQEAASGRRRSGPGTR